MLSPPDADLVRRDPALPGLATLLDPDRLVEGLRPHLPGIVPGTATAHYVRYKPGTSCLVGYRIEVSGSIVDVSAKAHRLDAREKLGGSCDRPGVTASPSPARIVWEDRAIAVSVFPGDGRLEVLSRLADAAARGGLLRRLLPDAPGLWEGTLHRLSYKPERRFVARLLAGTGESAVLKFYTETGYEAARRGARAFRSRGRLRVAQRIGRSDRHRILAFEWLPGDLLSEVITGPHRDPAAAGRVGEALATLHAREPKRLLPSRTREAEAADLIAVADGVVAACPRLARRARDLARRVAADLAAEPPADRPIHGDFYARQVLLSGDAVAVLDFDEAARGDPAADLGQFVAHLERDALRGALPPDRVGSLREALLDGYRQAASRLQPTRIELCTAAELFRLAPHPFRYREPDWPGRTEAILDRVEAILERSRGSASPPDAGALPAPRGGAAAADVPVIDPFGARDDPAMPGVAPALDPREVLRLFEARLPRLAGAGGRIHLRAIRARRHKPGRRCLIEYDVEVERPDGSSTTECLIGKVRAKGLDRAGYELLEALWLGEFGARSEDGISVPEPIGMIPEFGMWLQRRVAGRSATDLLPGPGGLELAARVAEAVHKLHRAGVPPRRRHTMSDELRILRERLPAVARTDPRWGGRLDRLLEACDRLGAATPASQARGIHRDFYADHVLVDGPRLFLLDFDLYCEGDPGLDVGNFLGHLTEQALRTLGDPEALADREAMLEERFVQLHGEGVRPSVRAYAALTLVRHIALSTQFPERRPFAGSLLDLCEDRLGAMGRAGNRGAASRAEEISQGPTSVTLRPGLRPGGSPSP